MKSKSSQLNRRDVIKLAGALSVATALGNSRQSRAADGLSRRQFSHPHRIRYDRHSLILENKPFFMYSGSFHYFRCAKASWRDRFMKIKEAGFNTVQTYAAWNVHELEMPSDLDDYSKIDLTYLDDWLTMATQEFGLYVSIRPGPYICAEWDTGGFPQWLITKKPAGCKGEWLRSDDPIFLAWSRHWYNAVCPVIAKHQITRKAPGMPGVMIFQVENEYDYPGFSQAVKRTYVESLVNDALKNGIDVPFFINWGQCVVKAENPLLRQVFDSMDFYPGWDVDGVLGSIQWMRSNQSHAPLMSPELQGGWFSGVGDVPPLRTHVDHYRSDLIAPQINNLTLFCIQHGVTAINYYMLFGGTNFGGRAAAGIATSYDYSAPIRENGGVGSKYLRVKALAALLKEHGPQLAQSTALTVKGHTGFADVHLAARQASDGGIYLFIRTTQHGHARRGTAIAVLERMGHIHFRYELEPFGSKILYLASNATSAAEGKWLPEEPKEPKRPDNLPSGVTIHSVKYAADPEPTKWRSIQLGQSLADLGVYTSSFSYYRATLKMRPLPPRVSSAVLSAKTHASDGATALLDGQLVYLNAASGSVAMFTLPKTPAPGEHTATLVYENRGHLNGGLAMESTYGVFDVAMVPASVRGEPINPWRMKPIAWSQHPKTDTWAAADISTVGWKKLVTVNALSATQISRPNSSAVFRSTLLITQDDLNADKTVLHFSRIDDNGWIYVNGKFLGSTDAWAKSWAFNAEKLLHVGKNTIAVFVQNTGGDGGLGEVKLISSQENEALSSLSKPLEFAPRPTGLELGWHKPEFDDAGWERHLMAGDQPPRNAKAELLSWHRLEFALPQVDMNIWLPWCLKIQAVGTGFIYVNGHEYGRFWEHGGQREYYLPDCWLNTGAKKNVIVLCLRAVDQPARIISASIEPYVAYAEYRRSPA